jgi:hypothetical protein
LDGWVRTMHQVTCGVRPRDEIQNTEVHKVALTGGLQEAVQHSGVLGWQWRTHRGATVDTHRKLAAVDPDSKPD